MNKKSSENEKIYFNDFCKSLNTASLQILPSNLEVKFDDRPDVQLLDQDEKCIVGIEITNFYKKDGKCISSEQKQRDLRKKVLKLAEEGYNKKTENNPVRVAVGFNSKNPIQNNKMGLANKISEFVSKTNQRGKLIFPEQGTIPEIINIYIHDGPGEWTTNQVHGTELLDLDRLKDIINSKSTVAAEYKPCDSLWLLIVIDFLDPAQEQQLPDNNLSIDIDLSAFKHVFLYETEFRKIIEVIQ